MSETNLNTYHEAQAMRPRFSALSVEEWDAAEREAVELFKTGKRFRAYGKIGGNATAERKKQKAI